ncbi:MAG: hypothetical protein KU37_04630 [Sulfuricurvum sp. PC08-66]|nr:MAG: hypothetical protein KU37_04630 [Sulfuricurvum sp. PC08-66]
MPANGFIGFITSQGFFIGLIFGALKFDDAFVMLFWAIATTLIFYVFAQISVSYFIRYVEVGIATFASREHEYLLDHFSDEIQKREEVYASAFKKKFSAEHHDDEDATQGEENG